MILSKIIAVDFDGTLCENKWPDIGEPNYEVINYCKEQKRLYARLILWTYRHGDKLTEAIEWCRLRGLEFDAVNENLPDVVATFGEGGRKIFAHEYIDDKASTKYKLPFASQHKEITDEVIAKLEQIFGFSLFDWQKAYLKGDDSVFPRGGRGNGKTFTHCLRLLLGNHESIDLSKFDEIDNLVDEHRSRQYNSWFRHYLRDLNKQLLDAGFSTNAHPRKITSFGDAEIAIIEAFIGKDGPVIEFKEIQALAAMQFEIYKQMIQPRTKCVITTNYYPNNENQVDGQMKI